MPGCGFRVRISVGRLTGGHGQVFDSLLDLLSPGEMSPQRRSDLELPAGMSPSKSRSRSRVQVASLAAEHAGVGRFLHECMPKAVPAAVTVVDDHDVLSEQLEQGRPGVLTRDGVEQGSIELKSEHRRGSSGPRA